MTQMTQHAASYYHCVACLANAAPCAGCSPTLAAGLAVKALCLRNLTPMHCQEGHEARCANPLNPWFNRAFQVRKMIRLLPRSSLCSPNQQTAA